MVTGSISFSLARGNYPEPLFHALSTVRCTVYHFPAHFPALPNLLCFVTFLVKKGVLLTVFSRTKTKIHMAARLAMFLVKKMF